MNKVGFYTAVGITAVFSANVHADLPLREIQALVDIYNATSGTTWGPGSNWDLEKIGSACRTFRGVTCATTWAEYRDNVGLENATETGYDSLANNIIELRTRTSSAYPMHGHMPASIANLSQLERLDIAGSGFYGDLPNLAALRQLKYLDATYNGFNSEFPAWITQLGQLQQVMLGYNRFTGNLPTNIDSLSQLTRLDISFNRMSGAIPESIMNLRALGPESLSLESNSFAAPDDSMQTWLSQHITRIGITEVAFQHTQLSDIDDLKIIRDSGNLLVEFSYPGASYGTPILQYQSGCEGPIPVPANPALFKDTVEEDGSTTPHWDFQSSTGADSNLVHTDQYEIAGIDENCAYHLRVIMERNGVEPDSPAATGAFPKPARFRTSGESATVLTINETSTPPDDNSPPPRGSSGGGGGGGGGSVNFLFLVVLTLFRAVHRKQNVL